MDVFLHICCGPCAIYPVDVLRTEGHSVQGFFYNPNIHPFTEFTKRRDTLTVWAMSVDLPVLVHQGYDLEEFLRQTAFRESERCRFCHNLRLSVAAREAKKSGFTALTTTLLYSRYQKHDLIAEIGQNVAKEHGIDFIYRDFREGWSYGVKKSKELGLYRQPYCGCIYSEKDRYARSSQPA